MRFKTRKQQASLYLFFIFLIPLLITSCATNKKFKIILPELSNESVQLKFPSSVAWTKIVDEQNTINHTREWVIEGTTGLKTEWIITVSKFTLPKYVSSMSFLKGIYVISKNSCESTKFYKPKHHRMLVEEDKPYISYDSSIGHYTCSKQIGKDYGAYTYQRIISHKKIIYAITIELRTRFDKKTGKAKFATSEKENEFKQRMKESVEFLVKGITIKNKDKAKMVPIN